MADKRCALEEAVATIESGMTIGVGGWGSRRKPMALIRALARREVRDLRVVSYGGPDVGLLCAAGMIRELIFGFVSLDSIPLEPNFRRARERDGLQVWELDEGMLQWGLYAAALRLPFLPTRAGLGSDLMPPGGRLRTITSPYPDGEELVAMPALRLDVALLHAWQADTRGNALFGGPDPYFDDLYARAADRCFVSAEAVVEPATLAAAAPMSAPRLHRMHVTGVIEAPRGAHFTSCEPAYGRDEAFQRRYAKAAKSTDTWAAFAEEYLLGDHADYLRRLDEGAQ